jgi:hypothetical protein
LGHLKVSKEAKDDSGSFQEDYRLLSDAEEVARPDLPLDETDTPFADVADVMKKVCDLSFGVIFTCLTVIQLRTFIRKVRLSPIYRQEWMRTLGGEDDDMEKMLILILDCPTRWSSTHAMLSMLAALDAYS